MVKPIVSFEEFAKLDLRVGKVVEVTDVPGSQKLYRMQVDLGHDYGTRVVFAGVKPWYKKTQLSGKQFIFVANLAPRQLMGQESQGMMLAVDGEKPRLIPITHVAKSGAALC